MSNRETYGFQRGEASGLDHTNFPTFAQHGGGGGDEPSRVNAKTAPLVTVTAQGPPGVKVTNRPERIDDPYDKGSIYSQNDISGFEKDAAHQLVKEGKLKNYNAGSDHFGPNYSMIQDRVRQNIGGTTARDFNNYTPTDRATGQSGKEINMDPNNQPYNPEPLNQAAGMMSNAGTRNQQSAANNYLQDNGADVSQSPAAQAGLITPNKRNDMAPQTQRKQ